MLAPIARRTCRAAGQEFVEHPRVDRRPVGGDLDRRGANVQRGAEQRPRRTGVAALGHQDIDDLAVLIDGPIEVGPAAGDLDMGFLDEPPSPTEYRLARAASTNSGVNVCTTQRYTVT
jgi:hypothetical protein